MIVETAFDAPIEEDIVFEETEQTQDYAEMLKNSENMLKAYMYLQKLMKATIPFVNSIIKVETLIAAEITEVAIEEDTGKIVLKNIDTEGFASFYIDGGEFMLFPSETIEIPITSAYKLEIKGNFSLMQTEYKT